MAHVEGRIAVDTERCKGCAVCIPVCPFDVLELAEEVNSKGFHYAYMKNPESCTGCANCALVCPDAVIQVYRKKSPA
jgi:2-oxoglutarate ferredoxin oxidoreductase subunit delta